ncbi:MAG: hypothetical protein R2753_11350 [Chitinophagales bacterium]
MRQFLVITLCVFSLQLFAQKNSYYLKKVIFGQKKEVTYQYQDGKDFYIVEYKPNAKYYDLVITKNKQSYFSIAYKDKTPSFQLDKETGWKVFNKKAYELLPQELKMFLAYLEVDQKVYQPQFSGGGDTNLNNGIPNALGPEIDGAADSSGSDCKQTGSCGCANGQSVSVTCNCGYVISCEERSAEVCDTDSNGYQVNCRIVKGCVGRCDAGIK